MCPSSKGTEVPFAAVRCVVCEWMVCVRACVVLFIHMGKDLNCKLLFIILECDGEQPPLGEGKVGKL